MLIMSRRNTESDRILESGSFSRTIGFSRVGKEKRMLLETLRNEFHRTNLVNDARNRWMSHVDIQFTNIRITGKINSREKEEKKLVEACSPIELARLLQPVRLPSR